ncbi:MAG: hypothetical protein WD995_05330 [Gemmatimonadota bacterium]
MSAPVDLGAGFLGKRLMVTSNRTVLPAFVLVLLATLAFTVAPERAAAQLGGPGFVFRQPNLSFALHGGYARPSAQSDLFDQTFTDLILAREDFQSPYFGGELSVRASDHWDVSLEVGHAWSSTRTEWREFVEDDGGAIWQTVDFSRTPVTVSGKYYLTDRGRSIGRFVWIPSRVTPFVGAGAGVVRYRFAQEGDFVDAETLAIVTDRLQQVGTGVTAHGFAGLDVLLKKALYLTTQARYAWARGGLDRSVYDDFEPVDLSGFQVTLGLGLRF